ncbi:MAG: hypothetical protein R3E68_21900 [Burkholderiaceae bacterium]
MTGGMICPPVDAAASTAPAKVPEKPRFLIIGIVNAPVPTTLAATLPDIVPKTALAVIAAWAGPPREPPASANAILIRLSPAPVACNTEPKTTKIMISDSTIAVGRPNTP